MMRAPRLVDRGFALIELVVTLAVVAIIGLGLATLVSPPRITPRDLARLIAGEARANWRGAIANGRGAVLQIDLRNREVSSEGGTDVIRISSDIALDITFAKRGTQRSEVGEITFFPDGSSTGGEILIRSGTATSYEVRVFWLTSEITIRPIP